MKRVVVWICGYLSVCPCVAACVQVAVLGIHADRSSTPCTDVLQLFRMNLHRTNPMECWEDTQICLRLVSFGTCKVSFFTSSLLCSLPRPLLTPFSFIVVCLPGRFEMCPCPKERPGCVCEQPKPFKLGRKCMALCLMSARKARCDHSMFFQRTRTDTHPFFWPLLLLACVSVFMCACVSVCLCLCLCLCLVRVL